MTKTLICRTIVVFSLILLPPLARWASAKDVAYDPLAVTAQQGQSRWS